MAISKKHVDERFRKENERLVKRFERIIDKGIRENYCGEKFGVLLCNDEDDVDVGPEVEKILVSKYTKVGWKIQILYEHSATWVKLI